MHPHNMPAPSAAHLVGLEYAYRLWLEVEMHNDESVDEDGAGWLTFSEQVELAIKQAREASRSTTP